MKILYYKDQFFPVGHVDAGKPVPVGLTWQFKVEGIARNIFDKLALKIEFDLNGYCNVSRNGDDPIQEDLRRRQYKEYESRSFEELYRIGLARVPVSEILEPVARVESHVPRIRQAVMFANQANEVINTGTQILNAFQNFRSACNVFTNVNTIGRNAEAQLSLSGNHGQLQCSFFNHR